MKVRLAVIDDEVLVRRGIISSIDWERYDIEIAGEATDGISGLELIRATKPHIVLTDIRMPHVDGLEMIRAIREEFPETKILILSVMEDFQTVCEALRLGVLDYVQKLLMTPEELLGAVLKIKSSVIEESQAFVREYAYGLWDWLHGRRSDPMDSMLEDQAALLLVKVYAAESGRQEEDAFLIQWREWMSHSADPLLQGALSGKDKEDGQFWLLLHRREGGISPDQAAAALQPFFRNNDGYRLSAGLSLCFSSSNAQMRADARLQADTALQTRFYKGEDGIFVYAEIERTTGRDQPFLSNDVLKQYLSELKDADEQSSRLTLETLFPEEAEQRFTPDAIREGMYHWLSTAILLLKEYVEPVSLPEADPTPFERMRQLETYPELRAWCLRMHESLRGALHGALTQLHHREEIQVAMQFTRTHYMDPIRVKEVAERVNLSENYFSYLFTKETGKPFVQYVQEIRVEQSKLLLREGKLKWYDIAEKVGFESPKYFTKVFKKYTGVTPAQYTKEKHPAQLF